jgi:glycosyltransferase involved in cell wall biosynthesis
LHKKNGGLSDARNEGIKIATGEYIGFVDSDDWVEPNMYERLYDSCKKTKADIVNCGFYRDYRDKSISEASVDASSYSSCQALQLLMEGEVIHDFAWSKLYKRSLFDGVEFPKGKLYEDIRTTYKLFNKAERVACVRDALYRYRQRRGSIVRGQFGKNDLEQLNSLYEILEDAAIDWSDCQAQIRYRVLKTKLSLFRKMLLDGEDRLNEFPQEVSDFYSSLKANRIDILTDSRFTKVYKMMALLSFFPINILKSAFSSRLMQKHIQHSYNYF